MTPINFIRILSHFSCGNMSASEFQKKITNPKYTNSVVAFLKKTDYYNCYDVNHTDIFSVDFSDFNVQIKTRQVLREIINTTFPLELEKSLLISKSILLKKIDIVFNAVSFKHDAITLAQAAVLDENRSSEDFIKARNKEEHWQQLDSSIIEKYVMSRSIYFLNESGFIYYIPALMQWSIMISKNKIMRDRSFLCDYIRNLLSKNINISNLINKEMLTTVAKYLFFEYLLSAPYDEGDKFFTILKRLTDYLEINTMDFCYRS
jgi:hypothetical protein